MTTPHIFISYSRQDKFFAEYLIDGLNVQVNESEQLNIWYDLIDIEAGQQWKPAIDFALDNSYVVLVICSPDSMKSHQVTYEWSYAISKGINIIPILYKCSVDQIHERLREYNVISATTPRNTKFQILVRSILKCQKTYIDNSETNSNFYNIEAIQQALRSKDVDEISSALHVAQQTFDKSLAKDMLHLTDFHIKYGTGLKHGLISTKAVENLLILDPELLIDKLITDFSNEDVKQRQSSLSEVMSLTYRRTELWAEKLSYAMMNEDKVIFISGIPFTRIYAIDILQEIHAPKLNFNPNRNSEYFIFGDNLMKLFQHKNEDIVAKAIKASGIIRYVDAKEKLTDFIGDIRQGFYYEDEDGNITRKEIQDIALEAYEAIGDAERPEMIEAQTGKDLFKKLKK